jgi:hypothetical protein
MMLALETSHAFDIGACASPTLSLPIRERPRREVAAPSRAPMKLDVTFDVPLIKELATASTDQRSNWLTSAPRGSRSCPLLGLAAGDSPRAS